MEDWIGAPILWLACRRHVGELHVARAVEAATGATKDPGMQLFRRLKAEWKEIQIDYEDLVKFDYNSVAPHLQGIAKNVLTWGLKELEKGTFPRDDYKELLELVIISLGGEVEGFTFKLPGPDHHARWMSKCIYCIKLRLLCKVFNMTAEENLQVEQITEFVILFYAKYWFMTPLACCSARNDLEFMSNILAYRERRVELAWKVLKSCYRHMWYVTPQVITLSLLDLDLEDTTRENIARTLHGTERKELETGKPTFPVLPWGPRQARLDMASLVGPESWLLFDLLGFKGPQVRSEKVHNLKLIINILGLAPDPCYTVASFPGV